MSRPVEHSRSSMDLSFEELYEREWAALVALGWSLVGSWPEAEDLVQDAFSDAYRRWPEVAGLDRPGAWIRRALINRAASTHRHRDVARRGRLRLAARESRDGDDRFSDRTGESALNRVSDPEFWEAVRRLPQRQSASLVLHYLEQRPIAEIAEILRCRPGTVKSHLHRARRTLAEQLEGRPDDPRSDRPEEVEP